MSQSDDQREEALKRLDERLDAIETERTKSKPSFGADKAASDGYRLLAELVGGVLGGLGLGWGFDRLAGTSPLGMPSASAPAAGQQGWSCWSPGLLVVRASGRRMGLPLIGRGRQGGEWVSLPQEQDHGLPPAWHAGAPAGCLQVILVDGP